MNLADIYASPIVQSVTVRYQALSSRDKVAVKYLAIFFTLIFLLYGVISPAASYSDNAKKRYIHASEDLTWMLANAPDEIQVIAKRDPNVSLLGIASSSAKKYYVNFSRYDAEDETTLKVNFERVLFKNLILWLENLEKSHGVSIYSISVQEQEATGYVSARVVLKG